MVDRRLVNEAVQLASVRSWGGHAALFAASAVFLGLSFPEPGWWWLAHVALVPAAWATVASGSVKKLAVVAYGASLAWWLVRLTWLIQITSGGYAVLAAFLALYGLLAALGVRWLDRRLGLPVALSLPMVWVSLEWVRGIWPIGGFCWFQLGHTQAPYHESSAPGRLIQIADIFSEYGVSFLVAMTNGVCLDGLRAWRDRRKGTRFKAAVAGLLWFVMMAGAWSYGQYRLKTTDSALRSGPTVAVIQTNIPQDQKDRPTVQQLEDDWAKLLGLTRQAVTHGHVTLVVWPETVVPAALNPDALAWYREIGSPSYTYHLELLALAKELDTNLLVGAHAVEPPAKRYNSAYLYTPQGGQYPLRYDKIHRVPFGEYIPWVEDWPWLKDLFIRYLSPYESDYTLQPGRLWTVFEITDGTAPKPDDSPLTTPAGAPSDRSDPRNHSALRLATPICFEDIIGRVCRRLVYGIDGVKRADLLVNLTNDGWYGNSHEGPQHLQMAVMRCVENRVPMARSVNTGVSAFIDSTGRVGPVVGIGGKHQGVEGYATATMAVDARSTFFGRWGHLPVQVLAAVTTGLVVVSYFFKSRR